jgi:signal transduction histidine kinase
VLTNLLTNAVTYSPRGGDVTVRLAVEEQAAGPTYAVVEIEDHGIGIPAADLPLVFQRFYRGSNVRDIGDRAGLGLSGSRQIVEQHDGTLTVRSREGEGTTATVRLPVQPIPQPPT